VIDHCDNESFTVALEKQTFDVFPWAIKLQLFLESRES
jgi:hypothetical protein